MMKKKIAVVLMNLGGPDSLQSVRPFLFNLFVDPAIIHLPAPFRHLIAWLISTRRSAKAKKIYEQIGGKSPLLENTQNQAKALKEALEKLIPEAAVEVFIAMRYWHPFTRDAIQEVRSFGPDKVVLLPLYPQFSTTTSASSLTLWQKLFKEKTATNTICCYPTEPGFVAAYQGLIKQAIAKVPKNISFRLLFSAHGLPQKVVDQGDPYEEQVNQSVAAIMATDLKSYDYQICYQSRVGPLKWLGPSLEEAMVKAAHDGVSVLVVPVSFVSEHSETLVELDIDFRNRAKELGIPYYGRVPTVSCHPDFIQGLANLTIKTLQDSGPCLSINCSKTARKCWGKNND